MASKSYVKGTRTVTLTVLPGNVVRHVQDAELGGLGTTRRPAPNPERAAAQAGADLQAAGYAPDGDWDDAA